MNEVVCSNCQNTFDMSLGACPFCRTAVQQPTQPVQETAVQEQVVQQPQASKPLQPIALETPTAPVQQVASPEMVQPVQQVATPEMVQPAQPVAQSPVAPQVQMQQPQAPVQPQVQVQPVGQVAVPEMVQPVQQVATPEMVQPSQPVAQSPVAQQVQMQQPQAPVQPQVQPESIFVDPQGDHLNIRNPANQLVNSEGKPLNSGATQEIPLPKIPSIPPGTIEEINNNYQQEQTLIEKVENAANDLESCFKYLKILYLVLLGACALDILLAALLSQTDPMMQIILDIVVFLSALPGIILSIKKIKQIYIVVVITFIASFLTFSLPLLVALVIAFFGFKVFKDSKAL